MHYDRMLIGVLVGAAVFLGWLLLSPKLGRQSFYRKMLWLLLFCYIGALVWLTMLFIMPWDWNISGRATAQAIHSINNVPFVASRQIYENCKSTGNFSAFFVLIGGNIAMLMPLAVLVPLINCKFKFWQIFLLAIGVSISIETLQLISNILSGGICRAVEIDDVLQNVSGCVLAYGIFWALRFGFVRLRRGKKRR